MLKLQLPVTKPTHHYKNLLCPLSKPQTPGPSSLHKSSDESRTSATLFVPEIGPV